MPIYIVTDVDRINIAPGGRASFNVRLSARPREDVEIRIRTQKSMGYARVSVVSGQDITFNRNNWYQFRTVTVEAAANAYPGSAALLRLDSEGASDKRLLVSVAEGQVPTVPPAIKADRTSVTVLEGGSATINVSLSSKPQANVTVSAARLSGSAGITVSQGAALTFTPTNYATPQPVVVAAAMDGSAVAKSAIVRLAAAGMDNVDVSVAETNATVPALVVNPLLLDIPEGSQATVSVKLSAQPAANVVVSAAKVSGDADLNLVSGASLTFTPANYATPQNLTLVAVADNDTANGTATFRLAAVGLASVDVVANEKEAPVSTTPKTVTIDPVTRIEGHLKIETTVSGGQVTKAWSTATLFRGIETILTGRDPRDAPLITQRLCGVCTYIHMLTSTRCLEDAYKVTLPENARIVRNLMNGAQFVHDHIVHFYHLHAMDWVDLGSALAANPAATATLAKQVSPAAPELDFAGIQAKLISFANTGRLGPFKNAYFGHQAYRLTPEQNLLLVAHYLHALQKQVDFAKMQAIFGGKTPHLQSVVVGGVTCAGELSIAARFDTFASLLSSTIDFVEQFYLPDVKLVASAYKDWAYLGGTDNMLAYGEFPTGPNEPNDLFLARGVITGRNLYNITNVDPALITEHVAHSWYNGTQALHPYSGQTQPNYTSYDPADRYSWLKAPRYDGKAMEVGPLARMLVSYGKGKTPVVNAVNDFLADTGLRAEELFSTLGRTAARAIETQVLCYAMVDWIMDIEANLQSGVKTVFTNYTQGKGVKGFGLNEAARGAVGHWVNVDAAGKIGNYQMVVPSTWNFGPRDAQGNAGPCEAALLGTPVADPAKPLEMLRTIHSFDPCIACGVHVIDTATDTEHKVKVL